MNTRTSTLNTGVSDNGWNYAISKTEHISDTPGGLRRRGYREIEFKALAQTDPNLGILPVLGEEPTQISDRYSGTRVIPRLQIESGIQLDYNPWWFPSRARESGTLRHLLSITLSYSGGPFYADPLKNTHVTFGRSWKVNTSDGEIRQAPSTLVKMIASAITEGKAILPPPPDWTPLEGNQSDIMLHPPFGEITHEAECYSPLTEDDHKALIKGKKLQSPDYQTAKAKQSRWGAYVIARYLGLMAQKFELPSQYFFDTFISSPPQELATFWHPGMNSQTLQDAINHVIDETQPADHD